ncbi:MAG: hypothetical protein IJ678_02040, partial [Kiritimatiellae bacterium]|nr:hypothetical protein [Kiritimatiellia bacterium]
MKSLFASLRVSVRADPSWAFFLAFAFVAPLAAYPARAAMALSLLAALFDRRRRRAARFTAPCAGWLVFLALAAAVTVTACFTLEDPLLQPRHGLHRL